MLPGLLSACLPPAPPPPATADTASTTPGGRPTPTGGPPPTTAGDGGHPAPPQVASSPTAPEVRLLQHGQVRCEPSPLPPPRLSPWDALAGIPLGVDPETGLSAAGFAVEDFDGDGHLDIYVAAVGEDHLLLSTGPGAWVAADDRLPPDPGRALGASAADWDGDGDVDILVLQGGEPDALLLNDGSGRFTRAPPEVTGPALETPDASVSAAWADVDGDGDLDLAVSAHTLRQPWFSDAPSWMAEGGLEDYENSIDALPAPDPNLLLLQRDGGWVDASGDLPAAATDVFSFASALVDLDGDLDPDLHVVGDFGAFWRPDAALRNDAGTWTDVSRSTALDIADYGMGLGIGDLNGDALPDFLVPVIQGSRLLESAADGTWIDTTTLRLPPEGLTGLPSDVAFHRWMWGGDLGDYDNDGDLDAALGVGPLAWAVIEGFVEMQPGLEDLVLVQRDDGTFDDGLEPLPEVADSRGTLWVDLDEDGFLDLVRADWFGPLLLQRNTCDARTWLEVDLRQPGPNTRAIGARVQVEAGGALQTAWVLAGGRSMAVGGPARVHFGLDEAEHADLVVTWPDGRVDRFGSVPTRQRITVVRAGDTAPD